MSVPQLTTTKSGIFCSKRCALKQSHSENILLLIKIMYCNIQNEAEVLSLSKKKSKLTVTGHAMFERETRSWNHYCVHIKQDTELQMTLGPLV